MAITHEEIKIVAPLAVPFISVLIDTWLKPKLSKLIKDYKTDSDVIQHGLCNKFEEYLARVYERHSYLTVLVFQNQEKKLEDLYVPMTVVTKRKNAEVKIKLDSYKKEFIPKFKKILITDTAGMGKSTVMKYLFLSCIQQNGGLPIFIDLRKLSREKTILNFIISELNAIDEYFDEDFVRKLIRKGDFVFFLDGFDEIPFDGRESVIANLHDFIAKSGRNYYIMTSRPEGALASFSSFAGFTMQPLFSEEAFELIRKYDNNGELSKQLIAKIEGETLRNIKEFLTNPFLVSLLYKSYDYKPTIPFKKHIFYRQVYDSLFENHDLSKDGAYVRQKYSKLDIEDFHRVLRSLGFITVKLGKVEYEKDEILNLIHRAKEMCPSLDFRESDFLKDLLGAVPLFSSEGSYSKWSHKSIQDYFAAQFICVDAKGQQDEILRRMYESENNSQYYNILDICYDIDYKTFRRVIIYNIVSKFLQHYDYSHIGLKGISTEDICLRKLVTFDTGLIIIKSAEWTKLREHYNISEIIKKVYKPSLGADTLTGGFAFANGPAALLLTGSASLILTLLRTKHDPLLAQNLKNESLLPQESGSKIQSLLKSAKAYGQLTDLADSPFNTKSAFKKINQLLVHLKLHSFDNVFILLDVDTCRTIRKEIEQEIQRETTDGLLTQGI